MNFFFVSLQKKTVQDRDAVNVVAVEGGAGAEDFMAMFVVPVLHHGGRLERVGNGTLCYLDGRVKKCDPVDVDFVTLQGLEDLGKGIGYLKFKAMYWLEPSAIEFEDGLHLIEGEDGINEICDFTLNNNLRELHIFFEHPIDNPIIPEVLLTGSSSSSDSYESAEDEAYKPPPPGFESDDSEEEAPKKASKGKTVSPGKQIHIPRRRIYTGKRKKEHILSGSGSGSGIGPTSSNGIGPSSGSGSGSGSGDGDGPASGSATGPGDDDAHFGPNMDDFRGSFGEEVPADLGADIAEEEIAYEYASEGFNTPVESDDERVPGPAGPNFNEKARFGAPSNPNWQPKKRKQRSETPAANANRPSPPHQEPEHGSSPPHETNERPILMMPTPGLPPPRQPSFRPKQRIFRPPAPLLNVPTPTYSADNPAQHNSDAISAETIAAAAGITSSRLLRHITNPTFNPPRKN
ncbi:hypothetical protein PIB30_065862 [Stylosanthes scabra]|uniref:PB1-like domain-containing protein n=1 Tax=Stylosanthes scabra TaxID=79078 RepID=A0ABU6QMJ3_9FABA|nr:hypothetical protein [Stylosanthes scabra]